MRARFRIQELRQALKPLKATGKRGHAGITFSVNEALTISSSSGEFHVIIGCIPIESGECSLSGAGFNYMIKALPTFKEEWVEIAASATDFTLGSLSIPCSFTPEENTPDPPKQTLSSPELLALREGLREKCNIWEHPELLRALRDLGQSLVAAHRAMQKFGVTADELLQLVASELGPDVADRLKSKIIAVAPRHPWR